MVKTKHRLTSVLLTLCLSVVMLAGVMLAAPVQVHARKVYDSETLYFGQQLQPNFGILFRKGVPTSPTDTAFSIFSYDSYEDFQNGKTRGTDATYPGPLDAGIILPAINSLDNIPETCYIIKIERGPKVDGNRPLFLHLVLGPSPYPQRGANTSTTPTEAPDHNTGQFLLRHDDFWFPIYCQLMAGTNTESVTVDTAGHDIDMIVHYVFDALKNTNRTLTIMHQGQTYVIRGAPESEDHLNMGEILLGHNHSFAILGWATQWVA